MCKSDCDCDKRRAPPPRHGDPCNPPTYTGSGSTNPFNAFALEDERTAVVDEGHARPKYVHAPDFNTTVPRIASGRDIWPAQRSIAMPALARRGGGGCCGR